MIRALRVLRRLTQFEAAGLVSLVLWAVRRRHGVPRGTTAVPYSGAQTSIMMFFVVASVIELIAFEVLLRALDAPDAVRMPILFLDAYGVVIMLGVVAAFSTRPHVVSASEVRIRSGAYVDLRVPRDRIAAVRRVRNYSEPGKVAVDGDTFIVAVMHQTNLVLELTEPVTAVRPLGSTVEARTVRFFADDPDAALAALHGHGVGVPEAATTTRGAA
ncbi:hypothetical protein WEI85_20520 [Actinomycetes bacterium KLBMP 9797]